MIPDADFERSPRAAQSDPALLSVAQAAERFKMSERAFRYWMAADDFPLRRLRRGQR